MALLFDQVTKGAFPAVFWLTAQTLYDAQTAKEGFKPARRFVVDPVTIKGDAADLAKDADTDQLLSLSYQLIRLSDDS